MGGEVVGRDRALHENDKSTRRPKVVPHDFTPAQLKERIDTYTLLLVRAANTQRIRFIVAQDEKWISYNNPDHSLKWCDVEQDPEPVAKRRRVSSSAQKNQCAGRSSEKVKTSTPLSTGDGGQGSRQSHTTSDGQHETASCENHPAKAPRDGVATPSTLFPGRLPMRFPCISKPGQLLPRTELRKLQERGVLAADLDRDQASRRLEERTRTTSRTMEDNRENTRSTTVAVVFEIPLSALDLRQWR